MMVCLNLCWIWRAWSDDDAEHVNCASPLRSVAFRNMSQKFSNKTSSSELVFSNTPRT